MKIEGNYSNHKKVTLLSKTTTNKSQIYFFNATESFDFFFLI